MNNRVLLVGYRILSLFGVPRFVRERHFRENCIRLERTNGAFRDCSDAYIENQSEWKDIQFGMGRHHNMSYSGCEIIASYNARKALGDTVSLKCMAELISRYEARGAALGGAFGVAPTAISVYFRECGFAVATAYGEDKEAVEEIGRNYTVMIATAYNDKNHITAQIHTVCITRNQDGKYVLHNAYLVDEKGQYRESMPYRTLQEAVAHISRREPKLIYLIGIAGKKTADNFVRRNV